jgi:hypothetical protein
VAAEAAASFLGGNADRRQAAAIQHGPQWFAEFVAKVGCALRPALVLKFGPASVSDGRGQRVAAVVLQHDFGR